MFNKNVPSTDLADLAKKIKELLSIREVARMVGHSLPERDGVSFSSPFRVDKNPSCSIKSNLFRDWTEDKPLDVIGYYARTKGISNGKAIAELAIHLNIEASKEESLDHLLRNGKKWPRFESGTTQDFENLQKSRGISQRSLKITEDRGLLRFYTSPQGRAWAITDPSELCGQGRLIDGKQWIIGKGRTKAKTLPGSIARRAIGAEVAKNFPFIIFTEGGPDFLTAMHLACEAGKEDSIAPVTMCGAGLKISPASLPFFENKRIRICVHNDHSGEIASKTWASQLRSVGAHVDGFSFNGLRKNDETPVNDLNDLCRIHVDDWENSRELWNDLFKF